MSKYIVYVLELKNILVAYYLYWT